MGKNRRKSRIPKAQPLSGSEHPMDAELSDIAQNSDDEFEFWMNMTPEQQKAFMETGESIHDAFERLHTDSGSEWATPRQGSPNDFILSEDFATQYEIVRVTPRSDGWMADANITGRINVRKDGLGKGWEEIIAHEAAHQLCNQSSKLQELVTTNVGGLFGRYNKRLGAFDGVFGEYNPEEAFATSVSYYYNHSAFLKEKYPDVYRAIDNLFKASPSAKSAILGALDAYRKEFL